MRNRLPRKDADAEVIAQVTRSPKKTAPSRGSKSRPEDGSSILEQFGSEIGEDIRAILKGVAQRRQEKASETSSIKPYASIREYWYDQFNALQQITQVSEAIWAKNSAPIWDTEAKVKQAVLATAAVRIANQRVERRAALSKITLPYFLFSQEMGIPPMIDRILVYLFYSHLTGQLVTGEALIQRLTYSMEDVFNLHSQVDRCSDFLRRVLKFDFLGGVMSDEEPLILDTLTKISLTSSFRELIMGGVLEDRKNANMYLQRYLSKLKKGPDEPGCEEPPSFERETKPRPTGGKSGEASQFWQVITPTKTIDQLIFSEDDSMQIQELVSYLKPETREKLSKWGQLKGEHNNVIILISGPSGTGKSALAEAIALQHGATLYRVDSSTLVSKYVGDTEKATRQIFKDYYKVFNSLPKIARGSKKALPKVFLWFDEADQVFSRRISVTHSTDATHNRMQNILLEELTRFNGVLIATANDLRNLDDAFSRRFNFKIQVSMPDEATRKLIWEYYLVDQIPLADDFRVDSLAEHSLSGAQIESIIHKTCIRAASNDQDKILLEDFEAVIRQEVKSATGIKKSNAIGFR